MNPDTVAGVALCICALAGWLYGAHHIRVTTHNQEDHHE